VQKAIIDRGLVVLLAAAVGFMSVALFVFFERQVDARAGVQVTHAGAPGSGLPHVTARYGLAEAIPTALPAADWAQNQRNAVAAGSPLTASRVLALLSDTPQIRVTETAQGTYVTVPGTLARGIADPAKFWTGPIIDGRWVGIVPLDTGGRRGFAYAVLWVWDGDQAHFIGQVGAHNGGLGQLRMNVEDGQISLQWPVYSKADPRCCPSLVRKKRATLAGDRLELISDLIFTP
jgi:hypothetical protein